MNEELQNLSKVNLLSLLSDSLNTDVNMILNLETEVATLGIKDKSLDISLKGFPVEDINTDSITFILFKLMVLCLKEVMDKEEEEDSLESLTVKLMNFIRKDTDVKVQAKLMEEAISKLNKLYING